MNAQTLAVLIKTNQLSITNTSAVGTANSMASCWGVANPWGTGTYPGTGGRVCNNTTTGALPLPTSQPHGSNGYCMARNRLVTSTQVSHLVMIDRCVDYSGFVANITTSQSMSAQSLSRYTTGLGVLPFLEVVTTGASAVACNVTLTYTNELGTTGRSAVCALASSWCTSQRVYPFQLQQGDYGVRSVQSLIIDSASPNAANFAVVLGRPVGPIGSTNSPVTNYGTGAPLRDFTTFGSNGIPTNACLWLTFVGSSTTFPASVIQYSLV